MVSRIDRSSPACAPQAMFAEVMNGMIDCSVPAPSPRSEFRSTVAMSARRYALNEERSQHQRDRGEQLDQDVQARAGGGLERVADRVADDGRPVGRGALSEHLPRV